MPTLDKMKVVTQLDRRESKLDLSHDHITTSNFMDLQPVMYRHMMPQEKLRVNANAFARLAPMAVPTYGRCRLNLRGFFVPFRTVMPKFNEFVTDSVSTSFGTLISANSAIVGMTPFFHSSSLLHMFNSNYIYIGSQVHYFSSIVTANDKYDYSYNDGSQTIYRRFTWAGRRFFKVLRSLGYHLIPDYKTELDFSALALLAYVRVYFDWYTVSQYMDTNSYQLFQSWFTYDNVNAPLELDALALEKIASFVFRVCYDGDYFTAAWDTPVAPNVGNYSEFLIDDVTFHNSYVSNDSANGTPISSFENLTQFNIDSLKALTDYMKRHQLSGARAVDRYLADYGISLPADKFQRSTYLGMSSIDIKVGDVMSHADTSAVGAESNLGDYAGKGYLNGGKTFEYQASEFGLFVIMASILPSGGYWQGFDRNNLHLTKDSFFNGDFDNLGVQTIAKGELYVSPNGVFGSSHDYGNTFGYTPRYAEYKVGRDQVTGDLSLSSVMDQGDSWHLMRSFSDESFLKDDVPSIAAVEHSLNFCLGDDSAQYSRIFNSTDVEIDKFYLYYHFDVVAYAPCKSLFDTYEFDSDGKDVTLDANGVKMN